MTHARRTITLALISILAIAGFAQGGYELSWSVVSGGGVTGAVGGELEMNATLGPPSSVNLGSGPLDASVGFWFEIASGDCSADAGINSVDYSDFPECVTGPEEESDSTCTCMNFDADTDVDLLDFAAFQNAFSER